MTLIYALGDFPSHPEFNPDPNRPIPKNKLSSLLVAAVDDCIAYDALVKKAPAKFDWSMGSWLDLGGRGLGGSECEACMAGAIMAMRGVSKVTGSEAAWQTAVDSMRVGDFRWAYQTLFGAGNHTLGVFLGGLKIKLRDMAAANRRDYRFPPSHYCTWNEYLELADELAEAGL